MSTHDKPVFTGKLSCPKIDCPSDGEDVRNFGIDRNGDLMYVDECPECGYEGEHWNDVSSARDLYREYDEALRSYADDDRVHRRLNGDDR